ncbi:MAG: DegT/DnrJ/EryC1/StrS family aminotransferase [Candidatus Heimdallarchaeota archaeon]|nr:MAG: DegT/DnrJ/EryC1/StrS family aminotransferase [Candidatus Aminicenantes bacterium]UCG02025.1 MAG: DegT/DnrJ/EryC1/StrS family aminotransferase [Candidatus Heimdallarchaeota archaeon]
MKSQIAITKVNLTENEIQAAVEILKSGNLRQGKKTEEFEYSFAEKIGAKYAVAVSSGTAALHIAYLSVLEIGDEVLLPSFTFIATASMVHYSNCNPIFCDADRETFTIDIEDAKKRITEKTKAIAPVHLFGNACDVEKIEELANNHNLRIIWDAAQAHGTRYRGKDVGCLNDLVCYSFYPSKNMITGEGGMVTTNNPKLNEKLRLLRSHGQAKKYFHTDFGFNYRMTDVEASIGLEQLKRLDPMTEIRRRNTEILNQGINTVDGIIAQKTTIGADHSYHQYCVLVDPDEYGCDRDQLALYLKNENILTGVHYPRGLHEQPVFQERLGKMELPVTEYLTRHILALPIHHNLYPSDMERIVDAIKENHK